MFASSQKNVCFVMMKWPYCDCQFIIFRREYTTEGGSFLTQHFKSLCEKMQSKKLKLIFQSKRIKNIYSFPHIAAEGGSFLAHKLKHWPEKRTIQKIKLAFHKTKRIMLFFTFSCRMWLCFHLLY